jgi:hypothetical protein
LSSDAVIAIDWHIFFRSLSLSLWQFKGPFPVASVVFAVVVIVVLVVGVFVVDNLGGIVGQNIIQNKI